MSRRARPKGEAVDYFESSDSSDEDDKRAKDERKKAAKVKAAKMAKKKKNLDVSLDDQLFA